MAFPFIVVAGLLLFRIGQLMLASVRNDLGDDEPSSFRNSVIDLLGRGAIAIGVIAPLLALPGYIAAATALVYPAGLTLGLIGVLFVLQTLVSISTASPRGTRTAGATRFCRC